MECMVGVRRMARNLTAFVYIKKLGTGGRSLLPPQVGFYVAVSTRAT